MYILVKEKKNNRLEMNVFNVCKFYLPKYMKLFFVLGGKKNFQKLKNNLKLMLRLMQK